MPTIVFLLILSTFCFLRLSLLKGFSSLEPKGRLKEPFRKGIEIKINEWHVKGGIQNNFSTPNKGTRRLHLPSKEELMHMQFAISVSMLVEGLRQGNVRKTQRKCLLCSPAA